MRVNQLGDKEELKGSEVVSLLALQHEGRGTKSTSQSFPKSRGFSSGTLVSSHTSS